MALTWREKKKTFLKTLLGRYTARAPFTTDGLWFSKVSWKAPMWKKDQTYSVWLPRDKLGDICKETNSNLMKGRFKHCQMFQNGIGYQRTVTDGVCSRDSNNRWDSGFGGPSNTFQYQNPWVVGVQSEQEIGGLQGSLIEPTGVRSYGWVIKTEKHVEIDLPSRQTHFTREGAYNWWWWSHTRMWAGWHPNVTQKARMPGGERQMF